MSAGDASPGPDAVGATADAGTIDASSRMDASMDAGVAVDASDTGPAVTTLDAGSECDCPDDDFYVDLSMPGPEGGLSSLLVGPHEQRIHCRENAPILTRDACNSVFRLSACTTGRVDCLYLVFSRDGFLFGSFGDPSDPRTVVDATLDIEETTADTRRGVFTLEIEANATSVFASGEFAVCARDISCPPDA